jgi:hypothetical protein
MLTKAEKINSDTAIDSTVRIVRRFERVRFLSTSIAYFIGIPQRCQKTLTSGSESKI